MQEIESYSSTLVEQFDMVSVSRVDFTSDDAEFSPWLPIAIAFFSLFGVACFLGALVELTPLLNKYNEDLDESVPDPADRKSRIGRGFISFSPIRNAKKLLYNNQIPDKEMAFFEGIKVLSIASIVVAHFYFHAFEFPFTNNEDYSEFVGSYWTEVVYSGLYSVDIFLFLSAFLGSYLLMEKFAKDNNYNPYDESLAGKHTHKLQIWKMYFLRILRIFPPVLFVLLFGIGVLKYLGSGPVWNYLLDKEIGG